MLLHRFYVTTAASASILIAITAVEPLVFKIMSEKWLCNLSIYEMVA